MNPEDKKPIPFQPDKNPFRQGSGVSRSQFRQTLRKAYDPHINISKEERVQMEKELFPFQKFGRNISEWDVNLRLKSLKKEKYWAIKTEDKIKIDRQIKILKKVIDKSKN